MRNYFKDRFFRDTFLIYMSVSAIILLVLCLTFLYRAETERREEELKEAQASAQLMAQAMDDRFSTIEMVATYIGSASWSPYIASESEILNSQLDYFDRRAIHKELGVFNDVLRIAKSTAILIPGRNLAVDRTAFRECGKYFQFIGLDPDLLTRIREMLENQYSAQVLFAPQKEKADSRAFCILRQIGYDETSRMILFILVDAKQFDKYISANLADAGRFQICQNDQVVYTYERSDAADAEFADIAIPSALYQWNYRFFLKTNPYPTVFRNIGFLFLGLFLYVAVIVLLAYLMCRLTYRPVKVLMERLGMNVQERFYGLRELENVFVDMRNQKEGMEELANQYYRIGQSSFYASLLNGTFDEETIDEYIQKFHTDLKQDMYYQVMAFAGLQPGDEEYRTFTERVLKLQVECYRESVIVLTSFRDGYLLLIMAAEEDGGRLSAAAERARRLTEPCAGQESSLQFFVGGIHAGLKGIHRSYREVREKLVAARADGAAAAYYYPFDMELKLIKCLRGCNFEEVSQVIDSVKEENRRSGVLPEMEYKAAEVIYETLYRYAMDFGLKWSGGMTERQELTDADDPDGPWTLLKLRLGELETACRSRSRFVTIGGRLVRYVEEHYASSALSQQEIADYFDISRPMVSKIFKETVNMNFVDYLQMLRVEAAKNRIDGGDYDMVHVARQCGYENETTFRRAFMKYMGVTPQKYINMRKIQG